MSKTSASKSNAAAPSNEKKAVDEKPKAVEQQKIVEEDAFEDFPVERRFYFFKKTLICRFWFCFGQKMGRVFE